jgi:ABC-type glycerol-3-phosphate transport system substrate-binding protein
VTAVPFSKAVPILLVAVGQGPQFRQGVTLNPLDSALRPLNFDPNTLLPGSVQAFTGADGTDALPTTVAPWCVAWRTDAFQAAGLPDPDPHWTLDAFETACAAIQKVATAGKVRGLAAVLAPMVGDVYKITDTSTHTTQFLSGSLSGQGLWVGFARGFGGGVIDKGRFVLSDPATIAGLGRLVDIAARYGLPPAKVPTQVHGIPALFDLFAMDFVPYRPGLAPTYGDRWRFARLPQFPVASVIPTLLTGAGLSAPPRMPADVIGPYVTAAADFLTWSYSSDAQAMLSAAGIAPVLADANTQARFWTRSSANAQAVGDWRHFINYAEGWPAYPPRQIMGDTLSQAVQTPASLGAILVQAEQKMNAALTAALTSGPGSSG